MVGSQSLGIWDTTAAPGLLDDWNCAHPVKIPFGWEGQLHECQQQFCVDLSLLVDHLTFVVKDQCKLTCIHTCIHVAVCTVQSKERSKLCTLFPSITYLHKQKIVGEWLIMSLPVLIAQTEC